MAITYRRDLDRKLTVLEMDTNFEELAKNIVIVPKTPFWWLGGLQFRVRAEQYPILNVAYSATIPEVDITLDAADPIYLTNHIIYANTAGEVLKRTGDLSGAVPDIDEATEYLIAIITVPAGATEPFGISSGAMYKENAEWTATKIPSTTRINLASEVTPYDGTYVIETSSPTTGDTVILTDASPVNISDIGLVKHRFKLKAALPGGTRVEVQFFNGATAASAKRILTNVEFGFVNTNTTSYQELVIPAAAFYFTGTQVTSYKISQKGSCLGWFLDDVVYQAGIDIPESTPAPEYRFGVNVADKVPLLRNGVQVSELDLTTYKDQTGAEIKALYEAEANTNAYTDSEKAKLGSIDATHYLPPLQTTVQLSALAQASLTDKARVYVEDELSDYFYDATAVSGSIAPNDQVGGIGFWRVVAVGGETAASIKTKYESNADTNAFTDAEKTKLGTIEANADVTDAVNVGSAVNDATAKPTPVDADTLPILDSAASFGLKKVTWANIKATLKTYFDGLYATVAIAKTEYMLYACSDETTDLTLGDKISIRMPFAMTLSEVRLSLNNAPTITKLIVDAKENGVSIFSTLPSIDTGELTSVTAAIPAVISDVNLADDALLVISITQIGSGDIGKGLKIAFKGTRI